MISGGVNVPNKKAAVKSLRQSKTHNERNRTAKSAMRTSVKKVRTAIEEANVEEASAALSAAIKTVNKTAKKKIIHKKKASRIESRLTRKLNALKASKAEPETKS